MEKPKCEHCKETLSLRTMRACASYLGKKVYGAAGGLASRNSVDVKARAVKASAARWAGHKAKRPSKKAE